MARNYQVESKFKLEHNLYMQILYMVRGYRELKRRKAEILYKGPRPLYEESHESNRKTQKFTAPTETKAIVLAGIDTQLSAVEKAINVLKYKYKYTCTGEPFDALGAFLDYGVFCYYRSDPGKELCPAKKTWSRYRSEFCYLVAENLNLV